MLIKYLKKGFLEEQFTKITDLDEIKRDVNIISFEIIKDKNLINKLEKNKSDYGFYFV